MQNLQKDLRPKALTLKSTINVNVSRSMNFK